MRIRTILQESRDRESRTACLGPAAPVRFGLSFGFGASAAWSDVDAMRLVNNVTDRNVRMGLGFWKNDGPSREAKRTHLCAAMGLGNDEHAKQKIRAPRPFRQGNRIKWRGA